MSDKRTSEEDFAGASRHKSGAPSVSDADDVQKRMDTLTAKIRSFVLPGSILDAGSAQPTDVAIEEVVVIGAGKSRNLVTALLEYAGLSVRLGERLTWSGGDEYLPGLRSAPGVASMTIKGMVDDPIKGLSMPRIWTSGTPPEDTSDPWLTHGFVIADLGNEKSETKLGKAKESIRTVPPEEQLVLDEVVHALKKVNETLDSLHEHLISEPVEMTANG